MWFRRRDNDNGEESQKAVEDAEVHLNRIKSRSQEITRVAEALRELRQQNHFAEELEQIVLRGRGRSA
jgi:hypothetical protein